MSDAPESHLTEEEIRAVQRWAAQDKIAEAIARLLCVACGVEPVDSADGSPHWWMWLSDAQKIVNETVKKFHGKDGTL